MAVDHLAESRSAPVLLTGAAGGIGQGIARYLAGPGVCLALVGRRMEPLNRLSAELREAGAEVLSVVADLSTLEGPASAVEQTVGHFGELRAVVSNAGTSPTQHSLVELTSEEYDLTFAVNTRATWLLARAAHPHLAAQQGSLIAIASVGGTYPVTPRGAYSASKVALIMLIRQLAFEWGPDGITCNTVSPGFVLTPMSPAYNYSEFRDQRSARVPARRHGEPPDIAGAVRFLLSADARYITGEDIAVDGGLRSAFLPTITGLA